MYLTKDIIGAVSKKKYAAAGDEVTVMFDHNGVSVCCTGPNNKFPVRDEFLSLTQPEIEEPVPILLIKEKNIYSKKKPVSPKLPKFSQPTLFD